VTPCDFESEMCNCMLAAVISLVTTKMHFMILLLYTVNNYQEVKDKQQIRTIMY